MKRRLIYGLVAGLAASIIWSPVIAIPLGVRILLMLVALGIIGEIFLKPTKP